MGPSVIPFLFKRRESFEMSRFHRVEKLGLETGYQDISWTFIACSHSCRELLLPQRSKTGLHQYLNRTSLGEVREGTLVLSDTWLKQPGTSRHCASQNFGRTFVVMIFDMMDILLDPLPLKHCTRTLQDLELQPHSQGLSLPNNCTYILAKQISPHSGGLVD